MALGVLCSVTGAYGVYLVYTAVMFGWGGIGVGPGSEPRWTTRASRQIRSRFESAGMSDIRVGQFAAVMATLFVLGATVTFALFGAVSAALCGGTIVGLLPVAAHRRRAERCRAKAQEAWPRLIEEMRILTGSVGRSIPQALFEVGRRGPAELQPAFRAAEREWLISTDFDRTVRVLKAQLVDPTADAVCETLLVAYEIGGSDLERRLAALAEDRLLEIQGRKDAIAKLSGVRFARRFVLIVPLGMALAGLSIGAGRTAYRTSTGELGVLVGMVALVACWLWAGRLLHLPESGRVFDA